MPPPGRVAPPPAIRDEAYVPVYGPDSLKTRKVTASGVRSTVTAGKIYVQGKFLFQVEKLLGVHVIDYTNVEKPVKLGFINSHGCSEVAFKDGYLIINNLDDLVFLDVRDIKNIKETTRIAHAFPQFYVDQYSNTRPNSHPPVAGKYYVCPDFFKGDVIEWKLEKNVANAYCYY